MNRSMVCRLLDNVMLNSKSVCSYIKDKERKTVYHITNDLDNTSDVCQTHIIRFLLTNYFTEML